LGTLVALGAVGTETLPVAAGAGVFFFAGAVVASTLWKSNRGTPLEWIMRRFAGEWFQSHYTKSKRARVSPQPR